MYTYKAKLDRVIDGDTIDANINLGFVRKKIYINNLEIFSSSHY